MNDQDILDLIHTAFMEWAREETDANEDSNVSFEQRFEEYKEQIAEQVMALTVDHVYTKKEDF
jgi:hypothetical protein|tara:strand:+ start:1091 stop:1279 length:189 start_codon:yes stop_codon:yes gene_type:complete